MMTRRTNKMADAVIEARQGEAGYEENVEEAAEAVEE